jgi:stearoyl-CoA desaturase (delta-9 desaturase)
MWVNPSDQAELRVQRTIIKTRQTRPVSPAHPRMTEVLQIADGFARILNSQERVMCSTRARDLLKAASMNSERTHINWPTVIVMAIFHVFAVVALFHFSWKPVLMACFLWWISGSLGIGLGYHRLLTHRGYKTPKLVEYFLTVCGSLALEGGPISWVGTHRVHHQLTDKPGDPHSPRDGAWWSHMGWTLVGPSLHDTTTALAPYVPELRRDRFHMFMSKYHWVPQVVVGLALAYFGGWNYVLWGIFARTVFGLHSTWLVNSATHLWGTRRFATADDSRNNMLIALLSFGEGWHNNHHAHPTSARHGLKWWEIDFNWYTISLLRAVGLVRDIKLPRADSRVKEIAAQTTVEAEQLVSA